MKILFILKERLYAKNTNSYGLVNSAKHVADYLETLGHDCKIVHVIDANGIDAEVFKHRPDLVIIEALWVTGAKMKELINIPRYRHITWVVRVHSDIGFLAAETQALKYINDYIALNESGLYISTNSKDFNEYLSIALGYDFLYLPNIITLNSAHHAVPPVMSDHINVACFGSLRILKNQCYQAMCAIEMAERLNKRLRFHITIDAGMSEENNRYPVLRNLEEMFKNSEHELVKHDWMPNDKFQDLIATMDIGMQVSYTESFNIVSADFVNNNIPIVVSRAISWMPWIFKTSTTEYERTVRKLMFTYRHRKSRYLIKWMKRNLLIYNTLAKLEWRRFLD